MNETSSTSPVTDDLFAEGQGYGADGLVGFRNKTTGLGFGKHHDWALDSLHALVATKMTGNVPEESNCSQPIGSLVACDFLNIHPTS